MTRERSSSRSFQARQLYFKLYHHIAISFFLCPVESPSHPNKPLFLSEVRIADERYHRILQSLLLPSPSQCLLIFCPPPHCHKLKPTRVEPRPSPINDSKPTITTHYEVTHVQDLMCEDQRRRVIILDDGTAT